MVAEIRQERRKTGTVKLYEEIAPKLQENGIKMGRNKLNSLLRFHGMLVKKTKRFHITTDSKHGFYKSPNRIKELEITHAEQALVADITYIKTDLGQGIVIQRLQNRSLLPALRYPAFFPRSSAGIQRCQRTFSDRSL